ncbi:hypothetical protein [Pseudomonas sp. R2-37-08W]
MTTNLKHFSAIPVLGIFCRGYRRLQGLKNPLKT